MHLDSHACELSFIRQAEDDADVWEYWQPLVTVAISFTDGKGRSRSFMNVSDFVVLRRDCGAFVECKSDEQLAALAQSNPDLWIKDGGVWHCSPVEKTLAQHGVDYEVWSASAMQIEVLV